MSIVNNLTNVISLDDVASAVRFLSVTNDWTTSVSKRRSLLSDTLQIPNASKFLNSEDCLKIWHPKKNGEFETDEWYTPNTIDQPCVALVNLVLGEIELDPCSPVGNPIIPAKRRFTIEDDCLVQDWWGKTYMNPPFSNPLPFLEKLCWSYHNWQVSEAIACLKSGTQANKGTGGLILKHASAVCQWGAGKASRIAFVGKDGKPKKGADFDCIFVYFGKNWRLFDYYFRQYGHVMPTQKTIDLLLGVNNLPITEANL